jgi:hypothetical protein
MMKRLALFSAVGFALLVAVAAALQGRSRADAAQVDGQTGPRTFPFDVDCSAPGREISPLIYGIGGAGVRGWDTGTTARRWGGNPTTRYNWRLNTVNLTKDWFFKNAEGSPGYQAFLDEDRTHNVKSVMTLPMIGWVAKDATSYSFPVAGFGRQQFTAPESSDIGNGNTPDGKPIVPGPPTLTSVASSPDDIGQWVAAIRAHDRSQTRNVVSYILDNEPALWNATHRDVHPDPVTYDELLDRTIAYGTAIRAADPDVKIAGPAEWGWLAYQYSAKDTLAGILLRPDRRQHGDVPLIPWYLSKLREHEQKTGKRILDILDVHFYPMADGVGIGTGGKTDPTTAALRIRSTRSLWDPTYTDESWINDKVRLIPRLREWIDANDPGLGISIGEWNFGAETHMSGALATAEALGHFGLEGVTSAYYWTSPADHAPAFWAFRAFRNFDGAGARFLDWTIPVSGTATLVSAFASRDSERRHVVVVVLNESALTTVAASMSLKSCGAVGAPRAFTYSGGDAGFKPMSLSSGAVPGIQLAPYSISVIDMAVNQTPSVK